MSAQALSFTLIASSLVSASTIRASNCAAAAAGFDSASSEAAVSLASMANGGDGVRLGSLPKGAFSGSETADDLRVGAFNEALRHWSRN